MDNKIDLITSTFEDKELEKEYFNDKWAKVKSFYSYVLIIMNIGVALLLLSLYLRGTFAMKNVFVPSILFALTTFLYLMNDRLKKLYLEKCLFLMGIISMPLMYYLDFERLSNLPHIAFMPLMQSIIWISIFPFNFIQSTIVSSIPFLGSLTLLVNYESLNFTLYIFLYFFPHTLLVSNKWKSERESRSNFLKAKKIEENRKLMNKTLKRYFGDELSDKIISQNGELEGENRWVSILFNDISDYSTITENMAPEVALEFLNEYFSEMHKVIRQYNGQILNYIGDSIMVVFGAPNKLKGHENKAIECAMMMREKLKELNHSWDKNDTSRYWKNHGIDSIKMRIGVHTGSVIAGNVGSVDMIQYSTIGDTVNVAARLEKANKEFGTNILFGDEVYTSLTKTLHSQSTLSGEITLKGRAKPTKVYSI